MWDEGKNYPLFSTLVLPYFVPSEAVRQDLARFGECVGSQFEERKSMFGEARTGFQTFALRLNEGVRGPPIQTHSSQL